MIDVLAPQEGGRNESSPQLLFSTWNRCRCFGCYGPSSAGDLNVLAGNAWPLAARTALSSTLKPRPASCGSAMYPFTGRSAFGQSRWPSSSNGRKYSVMMKFGMQADACTVALSAMVVEL